MRVSISPGTPMCRDTSVWHGCEVNLSATFEFVATHIYIRYVARD